MKKRRIFIAVLTIFLASLISASFVGCAETGPIPNGYYGVAPGVHDGSKPYDTFSYTMQDIRGSYGWVIDGDTAEEWVSGSCVYKAKIVEKDGWIYFEGYKWKDLTDFLLGRKEQGKDDAFLVTYNESERSFSLGGLILPS